MYGEYGIWARLAKMWNKCVIKDGKAVKRFEYVGD